MSGDDVAFPCDLVKERLNLSGAKWKLGSAEDFPILGENSRVEAEREPAGGDHADDFTGWAKG